MADGTLKVGTITTSSGSGTITLGQSGETVDMANGSITLNSTMKNTPAFLVNISSNQSVSSSTDTVIQLDTEVFDTDSAYDTSTYRFTPQIAGKYYLEMGVRIQGGGALSRVIPSILKNGSNVYELDIYNANVAANRSYAVSGIVEANGSTDYFQAQIFAAFSTTVYTATSQTYFSGYKLIGA